MPAPGLAFGLTLMLAAAAPAQSTIRLSALPPGNEWTTRVANGDFQAQGPLVGWRHPNPTGWSGFGAMYEGTAMFKLAPTAAELPAQGTFVPLNIDGANLPSDWYLRLAGGATKMLRGDSPVTPVRPINP